MPYAGGKMLAEAAEGIGLMTFNQPEKRNAMSVEMWQGLGETLDAFGADTAIRVVVLTGAGEKAFVSGADISQFADARANADAAAEYDRLISGGHEGLVHFPTPVIASIRGFCLGGGLGIAMLADLRIAAAGSEFGIPEARLGIAYGFEAVRTPASLVGPAEARMILYAGAIWRRESIACRARPPRGGAGGADPGGALARPDAGRECAAFACRCEARGRSSDQGPGGAQP